MEPTLKEPCPVCNEPVQGYAADPITGVVTFHHRIGDEIYQCSTFPGGTSTTRATTAKEEPEP